MTALIVDKPPRLLDKATLLKRVPFSFVTVWKMMREGRFPRAREVGGKSMWLESEVDAWIQALPERPYKGDAAN